MSPDAPPQQCDAGIDRPGGWILTFATFVLLFALAVSLAGRGGALESEFGAYEDEPAHVTTALMVRDWLAAPTHPVRFAEDYYAVYPKVSVGQWPPVYHGLLGVWMFIFGVGTVPIVLLSSALAAATGTVLARALSAQFGTLVATCAGAACVALPLNQELAGCAMTEVPVALFTLLAVLAFARYVEAPRVRNAAVFGWWAALAILTKGSGLALAFLPPLALWITGRLRLALRPGLWSAAVVVGVLAGPWYALTLPISRGTWAAGPTPTFDYVLRCLVYYPRELVELGGPLVAGFAIVGAALGSGLGARNSDLVTGRERRLAGTFLAWLLALSLLHAAVPSSLEARHLVPAAPAWIALAFFGARLTLRVLLVAFASAPRRGLEGLLALGLVGLALGPALAVSPKKWRGFDAAAELVLDDPALQGRTVLVASGAAGEGLGVLGFALQERPRRTRQVLRASKVLADAGWLGQDYRTRHVDASALRDWLAEVPVSAVLLDHSTPPRHRWPHLAQLEEALAADGRGGALGWTLVRTVDVVRGGKLYPAAIEVWIQHDHAQRVPSRLGLDEVLGRDVPRF